MVWVYKGALYCDSCGDDLAREHGEGDYYLDDSNDKPIYEPQPGESDSPNHCDSGSACVDAVPCEHHEGEHSHGAFLEQPLTADGYEYLHTMAHEMRAGTYGGGCHLGPALWFDFYGIEWNEDDSIL